MPKIVIPEFSSVAPAVPRGPAPRVITGAYDRSSGLQTLAQGLGAASDTIARDQAIERRRQEIEAEKAKREQDQAALTEEVTRAKRDEVALRVSAQSQSDTILADETIPKDQKVTKFQDWTRAQRETLEPTYKLPSVLGAQQVAIDEIQANSIQRLNKGITDADHAATRANVASTVETLTRQAVDAPDPEPLIREAAQHVTAAGAGAGWGADDVQRINQQNAETISSAHAARRVLNDPVGALQALKSDAYPSLTPQARTALMASANAEIEQRANRARIEAEARASKAARAMDGLQRSYRDGVQPTPQAVATAAELARGTEYEGTIQAMQSQAADRANFASKPLAIQAQELTEIKARATDPTIGATDAERFQKDWKEQQFVALQGRIKTYGPLAVYAETHGVELPQIDTSSSEAMANSIQARHDLSLEASYWVGQKVGPFTPPDVEKLGQKLDQGNARERLQLLDGLRRVVTDPAEYRATMGELAKGRGTLATAGNMLQDGDNRTAELMVTGETLLRPPKAGGDKPIVMPEDTKLRPAFDTAVTGMFEGNASDRDRLYQSSRAVYAALKESNGDYSDVVKPDLWRQAIDTAAGGIVDLDGWFSSGRRVIKPSGMSASDFTAAVRGASAGQVRTLGGVAGYTDDQAAEAIRDGGLVNHDDAYTVQDGSGVLMRADGAGPFLWDPTATEDQGYAPFGAVTSKDIATSQSKWPESWVREDGSKKSTGWLGMFRDKDGRLESERSIGVEADGREIEIPLFVPGLSHSEIDWLLTHEGDPIPETIRSKAEDHAFKRIRAGKSPFKD